MTSYSWPFRPIAEGISSGPYDASCIASGRVNAMALAGDLPDVDISDKGKITRWRTASFGCFAFADLVYGMLPHPKITEILEEVDHWTGFTRHFAHLKIITSDQKTKTVADHHSGRRHQSGADKMAECLPGATKSSLEGIQAWYIRDETYSAALAELVNAQKARPLAAFWGDGQHHRQTGRTFGKQSTDVMPVRSILNMVRSRACRFIPHISDQSIQPVLCQSDQPGARLNPRA